MSTATLVIISRESRSVSTTLTSRVVKELGCLQPTCAFNHKHRTTDVETIVRVLPPFEVEALPTELWTLLSALPPVLPIVQPSESGYGSLIGFMPNAALVDDTGGVGAVNTALEHMFEHRKNESNIYQSVRTKPELAGVAAFTNSHVQII